MTAGMVVRSVAGRDKGRLHVVLSADEDYALIADGKWRKIQSPKRKKLKHIQLLDGYCIETPNVTNKHLRRMIAVIGNELEEGEPCQKKM